MTDRSNPRGKNRKALRSLPALSVQIMTLDRPSHPQARSLSGLDTDGLGRFASPERAVSLSGPRRRIPEGLLEAHHRRTSRSFMAASVCPLRLQPLRTAPVRPRDVARPDGLSHRRTVPVRASGLPGFPSCRVRIHRMLDDPTVAQAAAANRRAGCAVRRIPVIHRPIRVVGYLPLTRSPAMSKRPESRIL